MHVRHSYLHSPVCANFHTCAFINVRTVITLSVDIFQLLSYQRASLLQPGFRGLCGRVWENYFTSVYYHAISDYKVTHGSPFPQEVDKECTLVVAIKFHCP